MRLDSKDHVVAAPADSAAEVATLTLGHLAHELNSLLDGSIRCLSLARSAIDDGDGVADHPSDDLNLRLQAAGDGMKRMAHLLLRAMKSTQLDTQLFYETQSLQDQIRQVIDAMQPLADEHGVDLRVQVSPAAATIRAATLGTVIRNGVRNAIEACAGGGRSLKQVELSMTVTLNNQLLILISDTGSGAPAEHLIGGPDAQTGHGFGLDISRRIVHDLGGELRLMNVPFGPGAILQVLVPQMKLGAND